mmetsp:Transcript_10094/g.8890  ORF Transcript_10094/g.8890 Transcript_10094/m.8890 type:complete len:106 (+) Transcript_10094:1856-2173(+)
MHYTNGASVPLSSIECAPIKGIDKINEVWEICYKGTNSKFFSINSMAIPLKNSILIFGGQKASLKHNLRNGYLYNCKLKELKTKYLEGDSEVNIRIEYSSKFTSG